MPSLRALIEKYPLLSLADESNQKEIFEVVEKTSMPSGGIQIGFDRSPSFFELLKIQGSEYFVCLMHNEDRSVEGIGAMSFRKMTRNGFPYTVGYASDLRATRALSLESHKQWRALYAEIIQNLNGIEEFENAQRMYTAVWDSNGPAQRALVKKNKRLLVQYEPVHAYQVYSVLCRINLKNFVPRWFGSGGPNGVRNLRNNEFEILTRFLCESENQNQVCWNSDELKRSLSQMGKKIQDFLVIEEDSIIKSICLLVDHLPGRTTKLLALPRHLVWLSWILRFFFGIDIGVGQKLRTKYLLFYRTIGTKSDCSHLSTFLQASLNSEKMKTKSERAHLHLVALWGETSFLKKLLYRGFISTQLSAHLYEVQFSGKEKTKIDETSKTQGQAVSESNVNLNDLAVGQFEPGLL